MSLRDEIVCVRGKIDEMKRRTDEMKRSVHGCVCVCEEKVFTREEKVFCRGKVFAVKKFFPLKMLAQCMRACVHYATPKNFFILYNFFSKTP